MRLRELSAKTVVNRSYDVVMFLGMLGPAALVSTRVDLALGLAMATGYLGAYGLGREHEKEVLEERLETDETAVREQS